MSDRENLIKMLQKVSPDHTRLQFGPEGDIVVYNRNGKTVFYFTASGELHSLTGRTDEQVQSEVTPVPMLLTCPICKERHIDVGEFATKVHHTHACQHCGHVWRPAIVPTVGVQFLPGFKNA